MRYQKASLELCAPVWAAVLLAGGVGCTLEEVDSSAIRTQGMYAEILAIAPGDGQTLVRANLTVGGDSGTRVHLGDGDVLVAEAGDASEELARRGEGRYEATLQRDASGEIVVRLERGEADDTGQGVAWMPEPFAMQLETEAFLGIERTTPVVVSWLDPSVDDSQLEWSVDGDCIWSDSGVTPDDGVMTLQPERVRVRATRVGEECEVRITLDRVSPGEVDPVFVPGSSFRAVQRRAVSFISTPGVGERGGPATAPADALAEPD